MSWEAPVPIFEDEDEDALISKFVEMSAAYPNYPAIAITNHIFKDLKDPELRANQAALQWSKNLDIRVRIDKARLNGNKEAKPVDTKEEKLRKLEALYNNDEVPVKERIAAMRLHAEIQGEITKAADAADPNKDKRHFPQIVFAVAEQSRAA